MQLAALDAVRAGGMPVIFMTGGVLNVGGTQAGHSCASQWLSLHVDVLQ